MDDLTILATRAARLRSSVKQADDLSDSSMTSLGSGATTLGLAGAGIGYGGRHLANQHLGTGGQVMSDLSTGLDWLGRKVGAKPANSFAMPRNKFETAQMFRNHGGTIGKAGLGAAALGSAMWLMGRNSDTAVARDAARTARGSLSGLQGENSALSDQLGQLRSQLSGNEGTISSLKQRLEATNKQMAARPVTPQPQTTDPRGEMRRGILNTAKGALGSLWNRITSRHDGGPA